MSANDAPAEALRRYVVRHAHEFSAALLAEESAPGAVPWSERIEEEWLNSPASELPSRSSLVAELKRVFADTVTNDVAFPRRTGGKR